ncbi:PspC family transcriptional regulator [Sphaerisporangium siamense]|uniref:Phage shock protein C n=2 Tax=Sphaerisporangium TaxID=321315 RepID=A0A7W9DND5_9ACTN|nr:MULTISPECIES: PspC domain-containing protein [Sphaerisporangium]MBB4698823.1 phage shock protein C [Sphaerisporangium siamense]MBB5625311.1 phage shock protein C [Sphaerisporangium krabiense]GII64175.1 PspC family transcriptional regulator [Sphaerisporangium krabiense]GII89160.1 PspC family transcriptional regulator [Sphaerisporangium siamense]
MYRSREHKMIAGVCGGLAEKWGWRPTMVRLLFLLSCVLPGPQFIIYLLMWVFIPKAPSRASMGGW